MKYHPYVPSCSCARCTRKSLKKRSYEAAFGPRTIWVSCPTCGIDYDESKLKEVLDIEEGLQGEDILSFVCPKGHTAKSRRRG